jgi:hypothetical protein
MVPAFSVQAAGKAVGETGVGAAGDTCKGAGIGEVAVGGSEVFNGGIAGCDAHPDRIREKKKKTSKNRSEIRGIGKYQAISI